MRSATSRIVTGIGLQLEGNRQRAGRSRLPSRARRPGRTAGRSLPPASGPAPGPPVRTTPRPAVSSRDRGRSWRESMPVANRSLGACEAACERRDAAVDVARPRAAPARACTAARLPPSPIAATRRRADAQRPRRYRPARRRRRRQPTARAGSEGRLMSSRTMLRSTSTLSLDACATAGGDSSSPRMLSRSIAFALSLKSHPVRRLRRRLGRASFLGGFDWSRRSDLRSDIRSDGGARMRGASGSASGGRVSRASAACAAPARAADGNSFDSRNRSVVMNGDWPLNRSAISASGSGSPSNSSARRKRSRFDRSHGSRATRSSAMKRASAAWPPAI